eukprot:11894491-Ditylum_brightwellii.AAC.1
MQLVERFSTDINMTFGLEKYAVLTLKNGRYSTTNILPEIPKLDDDLNKGYRCLGIMEGADFHTQEVKDNTINEYLSCTQKILKAQLLGDDMMTAICAYATPILMYTFRIMK